MGAILKDWQSFPPGKEKFHLYLASREWAVIKEAVRARSGGVCERCHNAPGENIHHQTYERVYQERLEDLVHLCRPCHEFVSGKGQHDPATRRVIHAKVDGRGPTALPRYGQPDNTRVPTKLLFLGESFGTPHVKTFLNRITDECMTRDGYEYLYCRWPDLITFSGADFLCCMGEPAAASVLETSMPLGKLRGRWHRYRGIPTVVTYHPMFVLENPACEREFLDDITILCKAMGVRFREPTSSILSGATNPCP